MAKQIVIKPNYIVLQETKDGNIVSALGYNKGGLSYLIDNHSIKFYLVEDYFYKNAVWSAGFPLLVGDALYDEDTIEDALKDIFVREIETMTVDTQLNTGSTNPIANSVVAQNFETTNSKFDDYYEKTEVDDLLDTKADASSIPTDYYDRSQTDALLANKADVSDIPSLNGYATEYWVQHQGYLTQHQSLAGLATEDWVLSKHYLTEHQSLDDYYNKQETITLLSTKMDKQAFSGLATIDYVDQEIGNVESELTQKANKSWVEAQGYLTEHQPLKTINHNIISGYGNIDISIDTSDFYTKEETNALLDDKVDNSALTEYYTSSQVDSAITAAVSGKADASELNYYYTKLETDGEINRAVSGKADASALDNYYTKTATDNLLDAKQDVLSAGTGIDITDNVISVTLDTNLFIVVQELPQVGVENKIYLVPSENTGVSNVYVEYIYENGEWEELGEEQIEVDLSDYYTKQEVDNEIESAVSGKVDTSAMTSYYTTAQTDTLLADKLDASAITEYWTSAQTNNAITSATQNLASEQYVDGAVSGKADTSALTSYYTSSQVDTLLGDKVDTSAMTGYYTTAQTDSAIESAVSGKMDTSAMTDYYTTAQTDSAITAAVSGKMDTSGMTVYALKSELPTIDTAITSGGTNAVEGGVIYDALALKLNVSDVDSALSSTSENPVQNKVIYAAIGDIESILQTI